ncbi:uncharacterized protein [Henckelia pumila]|uniref:uncharacterized protein n=1 Tax=Henckelia pumila TaxID=405737 RepID=UPI003C6DBEE0
MTAAFDRWEKDPFFSAAEEVQESADRMESIYRTWMHAKKDTSGLWDLTELGRDLQTTLGTTKWQLDEFERAVKSSYTSCSSADDAKHRHRDFITAIENQTSNVENSLKESSLSRGRMPLPWVRLNEGERDELALFLSGLPPCSTNKTTLKVKNKDVGVQKLQEGDGQLVTECLKPSFQMVERGLGEAKVEKFPGHRRTASANPDFISWKIEVAADSLHRGSSDVVPDIPPRKIPSFSGFLNTMESSMSQLKWPKDGYKKLKLIDHLSETDTTLPLSQNLTRGVKICYEKNKSCLDGCDDYYNRQLYGWYGAIQRQLQRSQYYMQYSRPVQVIFSTILVISLLVILILRAF